MKKNFRILFFCFLTICFSLSAFSQTLTVRDIMREPHLSGMRAEAKQLSPDGRTVIFAWNAEGKEPRNLYIAAAAGGAAPRLLVNAEQNFEPRPTAPESKLNYGLTVRDDFVKAREKNLGGVSFSPDSKRILFSQNTDIYVLELEASSVSNDSQRVSPEPKWKTFEAVLTRGGDLIPNLLRAIQTAGIQEVELQTALGNFRSRLTTAMSATSANKSDAQKQNLISLSKEMLQLYSRLEKLTETYSKLRSNEIFLKNLDELAGVLNRIAVARSDYTEAANANQTTAKPRRVTRTQGVEAAARWLTNDQILFSSAGNYFVLHLKETALTQVTREANPQAFVSVGNNAASKDGRLFAYVVSDGSRQRALFVPNYLDEFTAAPTFRRGFTEQKVLVAKTDGSLEKPFELKLPKAEGAGYVRGLDWAADDQSLIVDRVDKDTKRRQIFFVHNVGSKAEQTILVTEETDPKWIAQLSAIVEANPKDAAQLFFGSEKDGFNHLYLATLERAAKPASSGETRQENPTDAGFTSKVEIKQLTKGNWETSWAKWAADGEQIVFSSTEENTAERQFYVYETRTNNKMQVYADDKGMRVSPQLDETNGQPTLLYEFSRWNAPTEIYAVKVCPRCRGLNPPRQLTKTTPDAFRQIKWSEPKFIDVPTRDGKAVKTKVYLPANFDRAKKYPMVMFVHGAGYLQNTINGWNNYYREFMFNDLLTRKGYVVFDIDYRGSAGYGRDWRTDVHDFLGGKDYEDHLDAIDYAVKNYAVDARRVGVYGGSYGGFMAGMMVMRAPEKVAAAAALRPVFDWKNYFAASPVYTTERLGFPDKNPEAYRRSSPIAYAENLQKPLLILHGMVDDNVHVQDSIQLIEKLMRLEKTPYFEAMLYPSENHAFTRPSSWADEYERILAFFEKHLK